MKQEASALGWEHATDYNHIAICGTHSVGKTTLARALSEKLKYPLIEEVASKFPREVRGSMETQSAIMKTQVNSERKHSLRFVSDRSVIDNVAYALLYYRESDEYDDEFENDLVMSFISMMMIEHLKTHPYDLIVFVDEVCELEDNGSRCLNKYYQDMIFHTLKGLLPKLKLLFGLDVLYVRGSTEKRIDSILEKMGMVDSTGAA